MVLLATFWTVVLILTSCYVPSLQQTQECKHRIIKENNNKVVEIKLNRNGYWSINIGFNSAIANHGGVIYIGGYVTRFRLVIPGLNGAENSVSFQLYGHSQVFVRHGSGGQVYVDRSDRTREFNDSASFTVTLDNNGNSLYRISAITSPELQMYKKNTNELIMLAVSNPSRFQFRCPDDLETIEASTGLVQRSWFNITAPFDPEAVLNSLPNTTTTISNILPFALYTSPDTAYRIQGYWQPYFNGHYNFTVESDLYYQLVVEQANRTVRFCNRTEKCGSVIFRSGSTEAYYYVEILVYSGNASGLFEMDINVNSGQLKFAKFKKFDHSRESHRWTFANPCTTSCWDETNMASLNIVGTEKKLVASHLILNPENFLPEYEAGFSVGFWLRITGDMANSEILSYGTDFRIWLHTPTLSFRVENTRYILSTSERVFHVVFTLPALNVSHCYLNGTSVDCPGSNRSTILTPKDRVLLVSSSENKNYTITELFLWPSEMTPDQVLAEYQVACESYPSSCRWKNKHAHPDEWRTWFGVTPSYPFTGPISSKYYYFLMLGSSMANGSSAVLLSPKVLAAHQCLKFYYYMYGIGIGGLSVSVENESRTNVLWRLRGPQQERDSVWKEASINISSPDKSAWRKVSFVAVRGENYRSDIAISDVKLSGEECGNMPKSAHPGGPGTVTSCPLSCPSNYPCIYSQKGTVCVCDTRLANFVNQNCTDDIHLAYVKPSRYWSMDDPLHNTTGRIINVSFVTGVANKAIIVYKSEHIANISFFSNFSISMWLKINGSGLVFKAHRLSVKCDVKSTLKINTISNRTCPYQLHYDNWTMNVYLHVVIRSQNAYPYLQLYKNSVLQKPDVRRERIDCPSMIDSVELFPGRAYDDVAIWTRQLSTTEIKAIFDRYKKYKKFNGTYKNQPVIFDIKESVTDKEKIERDYYKQLTKFPLPVEDVNLNPPHGITIFLSESSYWTQVWMRKYLTEKNLYGKITSRYVNDKPPLSLTVSNVSSTSFNLSWEFTIDDKLSPFQGFSVHYNTSDGVYSCETTANHVEVVGLKPYTNYIVDVAPRFLVGFGLMSKGLFVKTAESAPSKYPEMFTVNALSSTNVEITWGIVPTEHRNGIIREYEIAIANETGGYGYYIKIPADKFRFEKDGLKMYHNYSVKIAASTSAGRGVWSPSRNITTLQDAPSAKPGNLTSTSHDQQSITFIWYEVPRNDWNSPFIEYLLTCCDNGITCPNRDIHMTRCCNVANVTCFNRTVSGSHSNVTLSGLKANTNYNCSVLAFNDQGQGPSAWVKSLTQKQVYKKSFLSVFITRVTRRSISLRWNYTRPSDQDSYLYLECNCSTCAREYFVRLCITDKNNTTIYYLMSNQYYNVSVRELFDGKFIENCSVTFQVKTLENVPPAPQNFSVWPVSSTNISLQWSEPPDDPSSGVILGYNIVVLDSVTNISRNFINYTATHMSVNDLNEYHNYSVKVAAFTAAGQGRFTPWVHTRTLEDVPSSSPQNFTVAEHLNSSLRLTWTPIPQEDRNGVVLGYDLIFLDHLTNNTETVKVNGSERLEYIKNSIKNYYNYSVSITGRTSVGVSNMKNWVKISNLAKVPPPPPENVSVTASSSTSLRMRWSIRLEHFNDILQRYKIYLKDVSENATQNISLPFNSSRFVFEQYGLKKYHNYSISMAVISTGGISKLSPWIEVKTLEDIPSGSPQNFTVVEDLNSSLLFTWKPIPQEDRNGMILGYDLIFLDHMTNQDESVIVNGSERLHYKKTDIEEYYNYSVAITGRTSIGSSNVPNWAKISNLEKVPPPSPQNVSVNVTSSSSLRITWAIAMLEHFKDILQRYEIHLKDVFANTTQIFSLPFNSTQFVFEKEGLKKYQNYSITMAVISTAGLSKFSALIEVKTLEDVPCNGTRRLSFHSSIPNVTYRLEWSLLNSSEWCGQPKGYRIWYRTVTTSSFITANVSPTENKFWLPRNLTRYRYHVAYVAAFTSVGDGPKVKKPFYVNDVPTSAPVINFVETFNSTSLKVNWSRISSKNGKATSYKIKVQCLGCHGIFAQPKKFTKGRSEQVILDGLNIYSNYSVQIAARNKFGSGNFSNPTFAMTGETAPKAAPKNVSSLSRSLNNLTVIWSHMDNTWGEIKHYRVHLYLGHRKIQNMTTDKNYLTFNGLNKSTIYFFQVQAATSKGEGPLCNRTSGRTLIGDPEYCPSNISLLNVTSKSVQIAWQALNSDLVPGGLASYEILYRIVHVGFSPEVRVTKTWSTNTTFRLRRLEESVTYWISVRAHVAVHGENDWRPKCAEYNVTTMDDSPDAPPVDVLEASVTSTSITIKWSPIPMSHINGILQGYRLNYSRSLGSRTKKDIHSNVDEVISVTVGPDQLSYVIKNLKKFTTYSITVAGYNERGIGPFSQHVNMLTAEDVPSRAPTNVRIVNHTSPTSLLLLWDPVPRQYLHGILTNYTVRYKATEQGAGIKIENSEWRTIRAPAGAVKLEIPELASYTRYQLSVSAETKAGGGIFSKTVSGDTCRCHMTMSTNWWKISPYIGLTESSHLTGVFPTVLRRMVASCCQPCRAHNTTLDFLTEGSIKSSLENVREAISDSDLSFPVYGSSDQERYAALYSYVPVINSPGEAFVVNREMDQTPSDILAAIIFSCWPLAVLSFLFCVLAGIIIWFMECGSNPEDFPPKFALGVYHGIWWAFVTSSTVGYGDRRAKTLLGKVFTVFWTLAGLIVVLILTSSIAEHLTTYTMKIDKSLYGKQVATILNSPQYNFAIRRNAKVNRTLCYNVEDMVSVLKERKVDGLLVDTYVAGANKELFSEFFRIRTIFDHKSAYGMVLARDAMKLETCFTRFIKENRAMVFEEIKKVVEAIEEPKLSETLTRSTKLFDLNSSQFSESMLYCGVILCVLAMAGLLYERYRRRKTRNKVHPRDVCREMRKLREDTTRDVRQFTNKLNRICSKIQNKHKEELCRLNEMKRHFLLENRRKNWTELTKVDRYKAVVYDIG